jgi:hypothetical protein
MGALISTYAAVWTVIFVYGAWLIIVNRQVLRRLKQCTPDTGQDVRVSKLAKPAA